MLNGDTMNIDDAGKGTLVRFSHPENGYDHQKEVASRLLTVNEVYEVEKVEIHSWHTNVYLKGFPGQSFNSVLFSDV